MSKLRKHNNNKLILVLPMVLVICFGVLLTYSFANFKSIKLFDAVGGFFLGNEYTLSYDVANCTNKTIKNGKIFGELCEPATPDGYTFEGWYYNDELIEATTQVHTNQNIQLLAHFTQNNSCVIGNTYDFDYTGDVQQFRASCPGQYKVELWGAKGTDSNPSGSSYGAYTSGQINLVEGQSLYVYVGEVGSDTSSGFNGGGAGRLNDTLGYKWGGGATDVRYFGATSPTVEDLVWNSNVGLNSRIMVAAGGGGTTSNASSSSSNSNAGGLTGYNGTYNSSYSSYIGRGGSQTAGGTVTNYSSSYSAGTAGSFGQGGTGGGANTSSAGNKTGSFGGGGGYYGGGGGSRWAASTTGGGGGSSYISGHAGSIAIAEGDTNNPRTIKSGCSSSSKSVDCSKHYSGLYFTNTVMIDGSGYNWTTTKGSLVNQPQPDGTTTTGHNGNGYARITYLGVVTDFAYTGSYQVYTASYDGYYQVELWGGSGNGVNAGYTKGIIDMNSGEQLYVFVGTSKNGTAGAKTFNAGTGNEGGHEGGGATDVRYFSTAPTTDELTWDNFNSLKARIMVAGGGGTGTTAGAGGGLTGYKGKGTAGGTQTTAGAREKSQYTNSTFGVANGGCSGGNGYYPGGGALCADGAGGGSSFISGYPGCNAISATSTSSSIVHTDQPNHYSGKVFINSVMIDGKGCDWSTGSATNCGANQPQPDGTVTAGHSGAGYARITYIGNSYTNSHD